MDTLAQTVTAACIIALGISLAESLIPMERFGKQIRWICTLLLFIGMLRPWVGTDDWPLSQLPTDDNDHTYTEDLQSAADSLLTESIAQQLKQTLNASLAEHKVNAEILSVDVHIDDDGSISIKQITVTGNLLTATVYLREWLGDDAEISACETEESE